MAAQTAVPPQHQFPIFPSRTPLLHRDREIDGISEQLQSLKFSPHHVPTPQPTASPRVKKASVWAPPVEIRTVWQHNVEDEFQLIRDVIHRYRYITIDTEFPCTTDTSGKHYRLRSVEDRYEILRWNSCFHDATQIGLTISNAEGHLPYGYVWEFNFGVFNPYRQENKDPSVFRKLQEQGVCGSPCGIHSGMFAELCWSSGLLGSQTGLVWVGFSSGFDFTFLLKVLTGLWSLPESVVEFKQLLRLHFGERLLDVKHLMKSRGLRDGLGLQGLAQELKMTRTAGKPHNAGSDSLFTQDIFQKMRAMGDPGWEEKHFGVVSGLDVI